MEIGANTCVDRATLSETRIGEGTKIDNLVQVGHDVQIGEQAILCSQVGMAAGSEIGQDVMLGGQAAVADHVTVGARGKVGAKSGVVGDVEAGKVVSGYPAIDHGRWIRTSVMAARLDAMAHELECVRAQLATLQGLDDSTDT